jgi:hypothetical protein
MLLLTIITYLSNSMGKSSSWEDNSHSSFQEILRLYGTRHCSLSWASWVHTLPPYFPKLHSNILPFTPRSSDWFIRFAFSAKILYAFSPLHACCMTCPRPPPWPYRSYNIWWNVQIMKFLIIQSSLESRHILPLSSKYSLQHPVLKHQ